MKTVKEMKPGVKYKGYGFINEYNEFQFTPSEIGSRKEQKILIKEDKNSSVYRTNNYIIFHCKVERKLTRNERVREVINLMNKFITTLTDYDI